jgi:hypothetical protein
MLMAMVFGILVTMMRIVRRSQSIIIPVRLNAKSDGMSPISGILPLRLDISRSLRPSPSRRLTVRRN